MMRKSSAPRNGYNRPYEKKKHVTASYIQGAAMPAYLGTTTQVITVEPR